MVAMGLIEAGLKKERLCAVLYHIIPHYSRAFSPDAAAFYGAAPVDALAVPAVVPAVHTAVLADALVAPVGARAVVHAVLAGALAVPDDFQNAVVGDALFAALVDTGAVDAHLPVADSTHDAAVLAGVARAVVLVSAGNFDGCNGHGRRISKSAFPDIHSADHDNDPNADGEPRHRGSRTVRPKRHNLSIRQPNNRRHTTHAVHHNTLQHPLPHQPVRPSPHNLPRQHSRLSVKTNLRTAKSSYACLPLVKEKTPTAC